MPAKNSPYPLTWKLDPFFKNEKDVESMLNSMTKQSEQLFLFLKDKKKWEEAFFLSEKIGQNLHTLDAYINCLLYEDTRNQKALLYKEKVAELRAFFDKATFLINKALEDLSDAQFEELLKRPSLQNFSFILRERKEHAKELLSYESESLITDLSLDGYHGFSQMFFTLHSKLKFPFRGEVLSYGQLENKLSSEDKALRKEAFEVFKSVFKEHESHFAEILNHIAGFRLKIYEKRGWDSILKEPLACNRISEKTLTSMIQAVTKSSNILIPYLERKAKLLKVKKLAWNEVDTSIAEVEKKVPYFQAVEDILEQFAKYSPRKTAFCKKALTNFWVDAEDRGHKGAGGFCIGFPSHKESRIFMTYSGTPSNVSTLAHELGHCYHNEIIYEHSFYNQDIKMNVAETASTMAEMIMSDAALENAVSKEEKIALLDEKLSSSVAYLMNLPARFIFEKSFYEERKKGYVLPEKLNELMLNAQKLCYHDSLESFHEMFWASKMHFYFTDVPFYNFPYTFGYLFSLSLYEFLKHDPKTFEKRYDAILHDTPIMTTEELAKKHLKVDITKEAFWDKAVQGAAKDVALFLELTKA